MPCNSYGQKHTSSRSEFQHLWRTPVYLLQETSLNWKGGTYWPLYQMSEKHYTRSQVQLLWFFFRILLPVLLLQNLRCKVRDDTAKLDIALLTKWTVRSNDLKSHKPVRHRFKKLDINTN